MERHSSLQKKAGHVQDAEVNTFPPAPLSEAQSLIRPIIAEINQLRDNKSKRLFQFWGTTVALSDCK